MKKLSIFALALALSFNCVIARDYTKLQIKELKHAQKYGTTKKVLQNQGTNASYKFAAKDSTLKDPKIMKLGNFEKISAQKYSEKLKADELEYEKYKKQLCKRNIDNYNAQAKGEDYYRVYRVAEKLIRANKLDYINWRIEIYRDSANPNAYTTNTNYIALSTAIIDTFIDNDDALAMIIGHEMGHAILGHQKRRVQLLTKLKRQERLVRQGYGELTYAIMKRKFLIDSKNMEFAADVEGEKLAAHAGYDLQKGSDVLSYLTTLDIDTDYRSDHPDGRKRLDNYFQNGKYFPQEIWAEMGKANIYNSSVMDVKLSSDRRSIILTPLKNRVNTDQYYSPESMQELYARLGYTAYLNREFEKSIKYFEDLFKIDQTNASAYLYASYASEYLYKNSGSSKYLEQAKKYAALAQKLEPKNKYILEQVDSL